MAYEVILTDKAAAKLASFEVSLQGFVETHLMRLGESPSSISQPVVSPPYPPGGMMYEFDYELDPTLYHHFAVIFRYSADETSLIVIAIGHSLMLPPGYDRVP